MRLKSRRDNGLGRCSFSLLAIAGILAIGLLATPSASAQAPSICDEYLVLPQCVGNAPEPRVHDKSTVAPVGANGNGPGSIGGGSSGGGGGGIVGGGAAGGDLPFTGYPLTPLLLLLLVLLASALLVRGYSVMRRRLETRSSAGP
jgi:hypothetical protein